MTYPDFSIIVPTFNRPAELAACLQALALLEYPQDRFEIIVVDDGGALPAAPVISRFQPGLEINSLRQDRGGPAAARNAGARIGRGRYLAFTDDDCLPAPAWLSALATSLRSNDNSLVGGRVLNAIVENPYSTASQLIVDFAYTHYRSDQGQPRFFSSNNMAMPAEAFHKIGGFDAAFRTSEDRDFCDRWLMTGYRLLYAPDAVIRHAHRLDFRSFWKQHMEYGRGAWWFYRAYGRRHAGKSSIEPSFYLTLLLELPLLVLRQARNRALLTLLLGTWQIANLAGFLAEAVFPSDIRSLKGSGKP
jgi:GT2 family glycosyltransferase